MPDMITIQKREATTALRAKRGEISVEALSHMGKQFYHQYSEHDLREMSLGRIRLPVDLKPLVGPAKSKVQYKPKSKPRLVKKEKIEKDKEDA